MSLRKRGSTWWVDIATPSGERIRRSAETSDKAAAKEYHDKLKAESWRAGKLRERPERTWDEAAVKFLREAEGMANARKYKAQVAFWTKHFRGQPLEAISAERVAEVIEEHTDTPATRNRYVACIRALLRKAVRWSWLDAAPMFTTYSEPKQRIKWITEEQATALLAVLPEWLRDMARFALATGLRQANVLGLEWTQVDLVRRVAWVHPDQAKARRAIGVPLNEDAVAAILRQRGKHLRRVFVDAAGETMDAWPHEARKAWDAGCAKVGLKDFRWHDLRHTWASWHVQKGTPLYVLQELGGWQTVAMVQKYAHLSSEHLTPYAERVTFGFTAQIRHNEVRTDEKKVA